MGQIKFWIVAAILAAIIWLGNSHGVLGSKIPALGSFFCPFTGFWKQADPVNDKPANLELANLAGKGKIYFDERQVPHIFAARAEDAAFLQGYVTAAHRLWQMDMSVRAVSGRLSEVLGPDLLERDRLQRRKGLTTAAANSVAAWAGQPKEMALIKSYADGVNAYIATLKPCDYPLEFKLLGYEPEPWSPFKSALFFKSMAETLCFKSDDVASTYTRQVLGDTLFAQLYPEVNLNNSPVIPAGTQWGFSPIQLPSSAPAEDLTHLPPFDKLPTSPEGIGSNNWAIAGNRSASGSPILCNDPHLSLTLPSIWYEVQFHTPEVNAYGVSLPGVPGVIIGFNGDIAWGVTNGSQDVLDWRRITWADTTRNSYSLDGQTHKTTWVVDTIWVRGQSAPVLETTPWTAWGPVVYTSEGHPNQDLAMQWLAHEKPQDKPFYEIGAFFRLMQGHNYNDYRAALYGWDSPAQNFVFADRHGDIGITVNGKFPLKQQGQGRFVEDGASSATGWAGYIPHDHVPAVRNPERGFVSSANQVSTDASYPYYYNGYFDDYRGRYINRRLEAMKGATTDDMKALQLDNYSIRAEEGVPALLALLGEDPPLSDEMAREMYTDLKTWNYRYDADKRAPTVYQDWYARIYRLTFDELYLRPDSNALLYPEHWATIDLLAKQPNHLIFDQTATPQREGAADIVRMAWEQTLQSLAGIYRTPEATWAGYQKASVPHLARLNGFGSDILPSGGFRDAPNALSKHHGPSWRMVVELTQPVKAFGVYPGGQSGNPGSPHYDTGLDHWAKGEYFALSFWTNESEAANQHKGAIWTFK